MLQTLHALSQERYKTWHRARVLKIVEPTHSKSCDEEHQRDYLRMENMSINQDTVIQFLYKAKL